MITKTDMQELAAIFRSEASELISEIGDQLILVEKAADADSVSNAINQACRSAHNLKGAAATVQFAAVTHIVHALEDALVAARDGRMSLTSELNDSLFVSLDIIRTISHSSVFGTAEIPPEALEVVERIRTLLGTAAEPKPQPKVSAPQPQKSAETTTAAVEASEPQDLIRISQNKLDSLLNYVGELVEMKIRMEDTLGKVRRIEDELSDMPNEIVAEPYKSVQALSTDVSQDIDYLGKLLSGIEDDLKDARMAPVGIVFPVLRRIVRDVSRKRGIDIELLTEGESVLFDRKIIEQMKNPLIHLIRNAAYHGIESPEERRNRDKPETGQIRFFVSLKGNTVHLELSDDGNGIDFDNVLAKAKKQGLYSGQEDITEIEKINLLFATGVSTAETVDEIAGRGIGLDVVKKAVEGLRGIIKVESRQGYGTAFNISIPQIISSNVGMQIYARSSKFIIPRQSVEKAVVFTPEEVTRSNNRTYLWYNDHNIPLAVLGPSLEILEYNSAQEESMAVIIHSAELVGALVIDHIQAETEIMERNLGSFIRHISKISGVTISSTGEMIYILEIADIIREMYEGAFSATRGTIDEESTSQVHTILVVDDSMTSRNVTKKLLSSSGFEVVTAANGVQALKCLEETPCRLVLSDVSMPQMDGFELARKIKSSAAMNHIPVVLLTSLATEEDKRIGFDSGADAYLVKGELTHGKLLETIGDLV